MISLENYELIVEKNTSKKGNEFCALFIKVGSMKIFINYINNSVYDYINGLSK